MALKTLNLRKIDTFGWYGFIVIFPILGFLQLQVLDYVNLANHATRFHPRWVNVMSRSFMSIFKIIMFIMLSSNSRIAAILNNTFFKISLYLVTIFFQICYLILLRFKIKHGAEAAEGVYFLSIIFVQLELSILEMDVGTQMIMETQILPREKETSRKRANIISTLMCLGMNMGSIIPQLIQFVLHKEKVISSSNFTFVYSATNLIIMNTLLVILHCTFRHAYNIRERRYKEREKFVIQLRELSSKYSEEDCCPPPATQPPTESDNKKSYRKLKIGVSINLIGISVGSAVLFMPMVFFIRDSKLSTVFWKELNFFKTFEYLFSPLFSGLTICINIILILTTKFRSQRLNKYMAHCSLICLWIIIICVACGKFMNHPFIAFLCYLIVGATLCNIPIVYAKSIFFQENIRAKASYVNAWERSASLIGVVLADNLCLIVNHVFCELNKP